MAEQIPGRGRAIAGFALGATFFGYAFLLRVQPSVIVADLMRDFAVGAAALGGLSAFYFYAYAGMQVPVGMLMDRFGPRRLMSVALLFCALGLTLFALAPMLELAALGRVMVGAGAAFSFLGALTVAVRGLPPRHFGLLTGLLQALGMAGAVVGQAPFRWLVEHSDGWREASLWLAGFGFLLALAVFLIVRDGPKPGGAGAEPAAQRPKGATTAVLGNLQTWWAAIVSFLMTMVLLAFAGLWAVPFLVQGHDLSNAQAASLLSLFFIGWAIGSLGAGGLSDRLGLRRPPILVGATVGLGSLSAFIYWADPASVVGAGLLLLAGIGCGTMILTYALARESNHPAAAGTAMGLANMATVGSGAVMQPVIGALLDLNWTGGTVGGVPVYTLENFRAAFLVFPVCLILAIAITAFLLRETGPGRRVQEIR